MLRGTDTWSGQLPLPIFLTSQDAQNVSTGCHMLLFFWSSQDSQMSISNWASSTTACILSWLFKLFKLFTSILESSDGAGDSWKEVLFHICLYLGNSVLALDTVATPYICLPIIFTSLFPLVGNPLLRIIIIYIKLSMFMLLCGSVFWFDFASTMVFKARNLKQIEGLL